MKPTTTCPEYEFHQMRRALADAFSLGNDLPEVEFVGGIYMARAVLSNGTILRVAVRRDDRKAHLCVEHLTAGSVCFTQDGLTELKGAMTHLRKLPHKQVEWMADRRNDRHPAWCHVEVAA
jgi:hypothetical protein